MGREARGADLGEVAAVRLKGCFGGGEQLPAADCHIGIQRAGFHGHARAASHFGGDDGGAGAGEGVEDGGEDP
jgi:hypothetical protein